MTLALDLHCISCITSWFLCSGCKRDSPNIQHLSDQKNEWKCYLSWNFSTIWYQCCIEGINVIFSFYWQIQKFVLLCYKSLQKFKKKLISNRKVNSEILLILLIFWLSGSYIIIIMVLIKFSLFVKTFWFVCSVFIV